MKFFSRKGLIYFPASLLGWLLLFAAIALAVYDFIDIDSRSHSVSDTLMNFCFNLILIWLAYTAIAFVLTLRDARGES